MTFDLGRILQIVIIFSILKFSILKFLSLSPEFLTHFLGYTSPHCIIFFENLYF